MFPLVGSTMVIPGFSMPDASAAVTIDSAVLSFTLPAGLADSSFAHTSTPFGGATRFSLTTGVSPTTSSIVSPLRAVDTAYIR